ncbi:murein hydrolase activator EnvC family protein [Desulfobacula sp.]
MLSVLKTNTKIAFFTGFFFFLSSNAGFGAKNQIIDIREKIQTHKKIIETFSRKELEIIKELNEIDHTLNKARVKALAFSKKISQEGEKIERVNQEKKQLFKIISLGRKYAVERLVALYKMIMIGRIEIAGRPSSVFNFSLRQNSMKQIISSDFKILEKQNFDLEKFEALEQKLQKQIQTKRILEEEFNDQIKINKKKILKKKLILKNIRQKKKLSLAMVESLNQAARKLDKKISSFKKKTGSSFGNSSFSDYQGQLAIPVSGKIISTFGPLQIGDYKSFTFQKGIDIKVKLGEPVKSVFNGKIMFAEWLKGYGNLLIIDHGYNYYTLYAHVDEVFKQKGESVKTGEVIATTGDTGSIKGPCLHFEIRHHGKPLDPMKWLKKGA